MKNSFRIYGVKESNTLTSEIDRSVEEIKVNGFTIVDEVLSPTQIQEAASVQQWRLKRIEQLDEGADT